MCQILTPSHARVFGSFFCRRPSLTNWRQPGGLVWGSTLCITSRISQALSRESTSSCLTRTRSTFRELRRCSLASRSVWSIGVYTCCFTCLSRRVRIVHPVWNTRSASRVARQAYTNTCCAPNCLLSETFVFSFFVFRGLSRARCLRCMLCVVQGRCRRS